MCNIELGNFISIACIICSLNFGNYFEYIILRLILKYFIKVRVFEELFDTIIIFEEILRLVFD